MEILEQRSRLTQKHRIFFHPLLSRSFLSPFFPLVVGGCFLAETTRSFIVEPLCAAHAFIQPNYTVDRSEILHPSRQEFLIRSFRQAIRKQNPTLFNFNSKRSCGETSTSLEKVTWFAQTAYSTFDRSPSRARLSFFLTNCLLNDDAMVKSGFTTR